MSEREFENYLALLAGLLRLSSKQRDEISGELRDHFEERLDELAARGMSRDEAIQKTLAEFGDAAGLAAAFLQVSRNRRKRWIMKWTAASIGGLAAAALLTVALWPENANVKLTPKAVAQAAAPKPKPEAVSATKEEARTKEDNNAATEAALAKQIAADFVETPLTDVISFLSDLTAVEFYVNWKKLGEEGIEQTAPISVKLKKVRVDMLLDLALAQAGDNAAYVLRDGIVVISSAANLENATEIRVYNCRDLIKLALPYDVGPHSGGPGPGPGYPGGEGLPTPGTPGPGGVPSGPGPSAPPGGSVPGAPSGSVGGGGYGIGMGGGMMGGMGGPVEPLSPADQLINVITTAVAPESWQTTGGFGTVSEYSGLLVVNHNARTHRQIEKVLGMLRESVAKDGPAKSPPTGPAKK